MFGNKKKKGTVLRTDFSGTKLHVNPTPEMSLARKEARLERVTKSLEANKWPVDSKKYKEMMGIKGRLELLIRLDKGEY